MEISTWRTDTQLGGALMEGDISIVGPSPCPNGFAATHSDTLTASDFPGC